MVDAYGEIFSITMQSKNVEMEKVDFLSILLAAISIHFL